MDIQLSQVVEASVSAGVFVVLWKTLGENYLKPFFDLIEEREARTEGDQGRAREKIQDTRKLEETIESELMESRKEGVRLRETYVAEAKKIAATKISAAKQQSAAEIDSARVEIAELKAKADAELENEVAQLSEELIARIVDQPSSGSSRVFH